MTTEALAMSMNPPLCPRCQGFGFTGQTYNVRTKETTNVECLDCKGCGFVLRPIDAVAAVVQSAPAVVVQPMSARDETFAMLARQTVGIVGCGRDGCDWRVVVSHSIDETQAAAVVAAMGGTVSRGTIVDSYHCPKHAVAAPVEQSSVATVIGVAK